MANTPPPYDPSSLVPPLTSIQSVAMYNWSFANFLVYDALDEASGTFPSQTQWNALPDASKIQLYTDQYALWKLPNTGVTGPPVSDPLTSVTDFLKLLTNKNTWIRVGEFAIGGILLAVGISHLAGTSVTGIAKKSTPTGRLLG